MNSDLEISPSFEEFKEMARKYNVLPVWTEILADLTTPVALFNRCVGDKEGFLLESVDRGEHWGRWSFIGGKPLATITSEKDEINLEGFFRNWSFGLSNLKGFFRNWSFGLSNLKGFFSKLVVWS